MLQLCCSDRMVYCRASIHAQLGLTSSVSRCRQRSHTVHVRHWSGPANLRLQLRPPPVPLWCHHFPSITSSCVLTGFRQHRIAVSSPSTSLQWVCLTRSLTIVPSSLCTFARCSSARQCLWSGRCLGDTAYLNDCRIITSDCQVIIKLCWVILKNCCNITHNQAIAGLSLSNAANMHISLGKNPAIAGLSPSNAEIMHW